MTSSSVPIVASLALSCAGAAAGAECAPFKPGNSYPWQSHDHMPGDRWAKLNIDVDPKGDATGCRAVETNMDRETIFWVCRAVVSQKHYEPTVKDGQPIAHTVTDSLLMTGSQHRHADEQARKRYFAEHPDERPGCYPS